jgi:hypothetical protein
VLKIGKFWSGQRVIAGYGMYLEEFYLACKIFQESRIYPDLIFNLASQMF